jgi:hypothetical protein
MSLCPIVRETIKRSSFYQIWRNGTRTGRATPISESSSDDEEWKLLGTRETLCLIVSDQRGRVEGQKDNLCLSTIEGMFLTLF